MKIGSLVLPDFPEHRDDWRHDWPDDIPGVVLEVTPYNTFVVMTPLREEEVNIEYLVALI